MRARRESGFTLIELIITVSVLVVILAMAIPSLSSFIQRQRIRNTAMDMTTAVTLARSEAIKRNANVSVVATGTSWSGGWTVSTASPVTAASTIRGQAAPEGITITEAGGNKLATFGPDGRLQATGLSFTVKASDATSTQQPLCVAISATGRTQTTNGACT